MKEKTYNFKLYFVILIFVCIGAFLVYVLAFKDPSNLVYIKVSDLQEKIKNKDSFILVVSQTGCSHCEQYLPELDRTLDEYDLQANVINLTNLKDEEENTLKQMISYTGTPTTYFFIDGQEKTTLNRFVGYASKDKLVERLQTLGYIE